MGVDTYFGLPEILVLTIPRSHDHAITGSSGSPIQCLGTTKGLYTSQKISLIKQR